MPHWDCRYYHHKSSLGAFRQGLAGRAVPPHAAHPCSSSSSTPSHHARRPRRARRISAALLFLLYTTQPANAVRTVCSVLETLRATITVGTVSWTFAQVSMGKGLQHGELQITPRARIAHGRPITAKPAHASGMRRPSIVACSFSFDCCRCLTLVCGPLPFDCPHAAPEQPLESL